jgi:Rhomboid family
LITPLLVQTLGWYEVVANLVTLALVGLVAEVLLGRWRWVVLFVAGTVGGQVAANAWSEPGGGDSIAICGLAAGVVIALLPGPAPPRPPERVALAAAVICAFALALRRDLHGASLVAGLVAGAVTSATASVRRWCPVNRSGRADRR